MLIDGCDTPPAQMRRRPSKRPHHDRSGNGNLCVINPEYAERRSQFAKSPPPLPIKRYPMELEEWHPPPRVKRRLMFTQPTGFDSSRASRHVMNTTECSSCPPAAEAQDCHGGQEQNVTLQKPFKCHPSPDPRLAHYPHRDLSGSSELSCPSVLSALTRCAIKCWWPQDCEGPHARHVSEESPVTSRPLAQAMSTQMITMFEYEVLRPMLTNDPLISRSSIHTELNTSIYNRRDGCD